MKLPLRILLVALLLLTSVRGFSSVVVPSDGPYSRYHDAEGRTLYIYDEKAASFTGQLMAYTRAIRKLYENSYGWKLDERADLVLTSPNQQIANAYATVIPNLKTVWFPSGALMLESMAQSSWLLALTTHETAHLYQLNAKGPVPATVKKIFGNAPIVVPFIPIFTHPNLLTPTFMLEGNAVMNESRFNLGGRLHSGEVRALVLAQIAAGDIDPVRLINDEFKYPYGENAYIQGGYFQAHLAAKYGVERTNRFFLRQGDHWLYPLILNQTFRSHFGESYNQEIREYVREMEGLAARQKESPGAESLRDVYIGPMNHDAGRVWFLATSGRQSPNLHVFDKTSGKWTSQQIDLPMGKVFFEGDPKSASAEQHDLRHIEYSLYGDGAKFDPAFRGQIVTDRRAGKTVALDAANSWLDPRLLVNGENFDLAHSGAVLDESGAVYYFRQNGTQRILYRDRQPVFRFDGFYSKLTEVRADGSVYFIASTDYGSSLFRYRGNELARILETDRAVDARMIGPGEFLVTEVDARGHRVVRARETVTSQNPAVYSYGFPSQSLVPEKTVDAAEIKNGERPYNSFSQLRYSGTEFAMDNSEDGLRVNAAATFTDPLEYQALRLGYNGAEHDDKDYFVEYAFTKFLPDFYARYLYMDNRWQDFNGTRRNYSDQRVDLGIRLPLLRHKRWDLGLDSFLYHLNDDSIGNSNRLERYGASSALDLRYAVQPHLGFMSWREFTLSFLNELETPYNEWRKSDNTNLVRSSFTYGLPKNSYLVGMAAVAWAETDDIWVDYDPYPLPGDITIPRLNGSHDLFVRNAGVARLEFHRLFDTPLYSARIPLGLNRLGPMVAGQQLWLDRRPIGSDSASPFEYGYGFNAEFLILHRIPAQLRVFNGFENNSQNSNDLQIGLKMGSSF